MKRQRTGTTAAAMKPYKKPRTVTKSSQMVLYRAPRTKSRAGLYAAPGSKEIKAIDVNITSPMNIPGAIQFNLMNGVQTGAGYFNRVGSRI